MPAFSLKPGKEVEEIILKWFRRASEFFNPWFQPSLVKCFFTKLFSILVSVTALDTRSACFST
jgi:hypothetical protein